MLMLMAMFIKESGQMILNMEEVSMSIISKANHMMVNGIRANAKEEGATPIL